MKHILTGWFCGVLGMLVLLTSCTTAPRASSNEYDEIVMQVGNQRILPEQIQAQLMAFTDTYGSLVAQGFDELQLEDDSLATRKLATAGRLSFISNAVDIASSKNPVTALLDMTVMVSLQRQIWEEHWRPTVFPDDQGESLSEKLAQAERDIWKINSLVLTDEQQQALRDLIVDIRERYPDQIYVSSIRASDYAMKRQSSLLRIQGGQSLLTLFGLDPMAGLSPATRQIAESRMLGERAFYYAQRSMNLLNWQVNDSLMDIVSEPELQRALAAAENAADASQRVAAVSEDLAGRLTEERTAAIDQVAERLSVEREAAIEQVMTGVDTQVETLFERLNEEQAELKGVLVEVRDSIEASRQLSDSFEQTLVEANRLTASMERLKNPDSRPFDLVELNTAVVSATEGVRELQVALGTANEMVGTLASDEQNERLTRMLDDGQTTLGELIDQAFRRGLMLVAAFIVGLIVVVIVHRLLAARSGARPSASA
jgi:hypothetical protein